MPSYLSPGVYVEEVPSGSSSLSAGATAVAAFVGFTAKAPTDDPADPEGLKPRLVTNWSQFEELYGGFTPGALLPHSVYGYFNNGGSVAYIVRVPHTAPSGKPAQLALPAVDKALGAPIEVTTQKNDADLSVSVEPGPEPDGDNPAQTFNLSVLEGGKVVETFTGLTLGKGDKAVDKVVNAESKYVKVATKLAPDAKIDETMKILKPGTYPAVKATPNAIKVQPKSFTGSETARTGINGLVIADDVTMVIVPDLETAAKTTDGKTDLAMWKSVQTSLLAHCEAQGNRMAILDAPPGLSVQQMKEWREEVAMYDSAFGALYYPRIKIDNPAATNGDREIFIGPSGHIAGIWARTDDTRGVWKAPANEVIRGALDVELPITKAEQGLLNPIGVNCIRPFGTRGIRVWGARTLSSDTDWRYVNVRRLFNMIETTIMEGTQWVVFEPNDLKLWQGVKRTLNAFLRGLWRDGALFGTTAEQAFYVKCDEETNPPESIEEGKLVVEVGIAPVRPAEFVIFRISQYKQDVAA